MSINSWRSGDWDTCIICKQDIDANIEANGDWRLSDGEYVCTQCEESTNEHTD